MPKPKFLFMQHKNSFSVHIENLEELQVPQIQAIEEFVSQRKGVFDFNSYTFVIQKKMEFEEFLSLLEHSFLDVVCTEKFLKTKTQTRVEFGKYKGLLYSELPDSYLLWLKANYVGKDRENIDIELKNRSL